MDARLVGVGGFAPLLVMRNAVECGSDGGEYCKWGVRALDIGVPPRDGGHLGARMFGSNGLSSLALTDPGVGGTTG
jgi:hypothetical protein